MEPEKVIERAELYMWYNSYLEKQNYCASTKKHLLCKIKHLLSYMTEQELTVYTSAVGYRYLEVIHGSMSIAFWNEQKRMIYILSSFVQGKPIQVRRNTMKVIEFHGSDGQCAVSFIEAYAKDKLLSQNRVEQYERSLSRFCEYLRLVNKSFKTMGREDIIDFISTPTNRKCSYIVALRVFLKYLSEQGISRMNLSYLLNNIKYGESEKVPSYYSISEIKKIEGAVNRSSFCGKRDYAMLLLASRLGLRASDITALCFSNINWDTNKINLVQKKTGKELELPLLGEVGEAIIDYILYARPKIDLQTIFVSDRHPYRKINSTTFGTLVAKYIRQSGVEINDRHHGSHALRHSLAGALLQASTSLPVISEALGHHDTQATMFYLSINVDMLVRCSLDVPSVSKEFYTQNGGALYE
jgi:site-specific recombinase XerD